MSLVTKAETLCDSVYSTHNAWDMIHCLFLKRACFSGQETEINTTIFMRLSISSCLVSVLMKKIAVCGYALNVAFGLLQLIQSVFVALLLAEQCLSK
jgi:hypothetical protein